MYYIAAITCIIFTILMLFNVSVVDIEMYRNALVFILR